MDGKWQKDVCGMSIDARPFSHDIEIEQIKRDGSGRPLIANDEVVRTIKKFHFGSD